MTAAHILLRGGRPAGAGLTDDAVVAAAMADPQAFGIIYERYFVSFVFEFSILTVPVK